MTKLLEQAIAKIREFPEEEQDALAITLIAMAQASIVSLDGKARGAILEGLQQARLGKFVPDEEIAALWKRYGL
jgi:predicted transcriptional regulator